MNDEEWALISDQFHTWSGGGRMGRPAKHDKRRIVDAVFHVAATGCQWRALPERYPNWNTVHRYHLACHVTERGNEWPTGCRRSCVPRPVMTRNRRRR